MHVGYILALIAASSNQYTPSFPGGGIIAWIVCYRKRRDEIGGWLMLYYWQLYGGLILTIIFFAIAFQSYVPESFDDPGRYHMFLLSIVPTLVLLGLEIAIASIMLSVRSWDLVVLLRYTMAAALIAAFAGVWIDVKFFPDNLGFDALTIVPAIIWLLYFSLSSRVAHVFKTHDWDIAVEAIYPTPDMKPTLGL